MKRAWDALTKRQQLAVALAGAAIAGVLLLQFVLLPLHEGRMKMEKSIAANARIARELEPLGREYLSAKQSCDLVRTTATRRSADFTLFTYLEGRANEAGIRSAVMYINPLKPTRIGGLEEVAVEMKLDKLTLKQLSRFLYLVETPEDLIGIKKAAISRMKESPDYLTAVIQVVTYRLAGQGGTDNR